MKKLLACILLLAAPLVAQSYRGPGASPAATSLAFETSLGYTYFAMDTPSQQRVFLSGVDANAFVDLNARWGVLANSSYARTGDVFGTGHSGNVFSLLCGPEFYPVAYANTRMFVHSMAGVSMVDSAVPVSGTYYLSGAVARFSYAVGGGVDHPLFGPFTLRVGGDYVRTTFADPTATMRFQNNLRLVTSVSYRFRKR
ncbi:MAG: hypothetical protein WAK29_22010 [Terriglobales bacterium]